MRLLRYYASKDDPPRRHAQLIRCYHGKLLGVEIQNGMRCWRWLWRLCK